MVSLHRRVREEAPSHVRTEEFLHTLFRRCNKTASERVLLENPYTRGSKTPLKKSFFFLERGPGGESLPAAWALEIDGF